MTPLYDDVMLGNGGGGGVTYQPPLEQQSSAPPPPPPIEFGEGDFFALPFVDIDSPTNGQIDSTNDSDSPPPLMGTDDPFSVVADLGRNLFGGGSGVPQTTYVPISGGGSGSAGGSSMMLVVIALALIGGAVWWYFKKRGSNASAS